MSQSAKDLLEARKAKILADAEAAAAELDRDLAELERIFAKYGLGLSSESAPTTGGGMEMRVVSNLSDMPTSRAAPEAAIAMLAEKVAIQVKDVLEYLEQRHVQVGGKRPLSTLSAYLSADARLTPASKGWWKLSGQKDRKLGVPHRPVDKAVNGSGRVHGA